MILKIPANESPEPSGFIGEFYQIFKELAAILFKLFFKKLRRRNASELILQGLHHLYTKPDKDITSKECPWFIQNKWEVQFSRSVVSDYLWPSGLQHARLTCLAPTPGACSNSCPLSWWCHPTISSSVVPFSCFQSFPASGFFFFQ